MFCAALTTAWPQLHERVLVFRKPAPGIAPQGAVERLHLSPAPRRTLRTRRDDD